MIRGSGTILLGVPGMAIGLVLPGLGGGGGGFRSAGDNWGIGEGEGDGIVLFTGVTGREGAALEGRLGRGGGILFSSLGASVSALGVLAGDQGKAGLSRLLAGELLRDAC